METTHGILNQSRETRPETWRPWDKEEFGPAGGPSAASRLGVMMARGATPSKTREFAVAVGLNPPTASEVGTKVYKENLGRLLAHGLTVHGSTRCPRCAREAEVLYVYTDAELELEDEKVYSCDYCESDAAWIVRQVVGVPIGDLAEACHALTNYCEDLAAECEGWPEDSEERAEYLRTRALRDRLFLMGVQARQSFDPLGTGKAHREDLLHGELPYRECRHCDSPEVAYLSASLGVLPSGNRLDFQCEECGHHTVTMATSAEVECVRQYLETPAMPPTWATGEACAECGWLPGCQYGDHHPECPTLREREESVAPKVSRWAKLRDLVKLAVRECRAVRVFLLLALAVALVASISACTPQQANQWLHDYYVRTGDPRACTEDMDCWDCETMGNRDCGPALTHRGATGTMSVRAGEHHQCSTDLECEQQFKVAITGEAL